MLVAAFRGYTPKTKKASVTVLCGKTLAFSQCTRMGSNH